MRAGRVFDAERMRDDLWPVKPWCVTSYNVAGRSLGEFACRSLSEAYRRRDSELRAGASVVVVEAVA